MQVYQTIASCEMGQTHVVPIFCYEWGGTGRDFITYIILAISTDDLLNRLKKVQEYRYIMGNLFTEKTTNADDIVGTC